jgi:predicted RNase H-like HicB family nuclease
MDQPKYHIDIFWSDEHGGYIANVPALRYCCSAFGESYEEALREVLVAMELHLDALRELDRPIPEPEGREVSAGAIQGAFENWVETLEDQAELNRPTLQTLDELTEAQRQAIGEFWAASSGPAKRKAAG